MQNGYAMDTVCPEVDILCLEHHDGYYQDGLIIWPHIISTNERLSKELISGWRSPALQLQLQLQHHITDDYVSPLRRAVLLRCLESEGQHQDTYRHRTAALRRCLTRAQPDNEGEHTRSGELQTSHQQLLIVSRIWKIFPISQKYFSVFDLSFKSFLWGEIISTK